MHWKLSSKAKIASDFSNLLHINQGNLRSGEFFLFRRGKKKFSPVKKKKKSPLIAGYKQGEKQISRKIVGKNVHATITKGNMGYVQYSVPDTVSVEPTLVAFL